MAILLGTRGAGERAADGAAAGRFSKDEKASSHISSELRRYTGLFNYLFFWRQSATHMKYKEKCGAAALFCYIQNLRPLFAQKNKNLHTDTAKSAVPVSFAEYVGPRSGPTYRGPDERCSIGCQPQTGRHASLIRATICC